MSSLETLERQHFIRRLFEGDPSLWSRDPGQQARITERLGWLTIHEEMAERFDDLRRFADDVVERGYRRVVLLGMGGSSLAPEVFQRVIGNAPGHPSLTVLDTTDPAAILDLERSIDLARTMFIVSSKSGTTIETLSLYRYFADRYGGGRGENVRLDNFVAITDPETPLHYQADRSGFRHVFLNPPDVGGRYSALSYFGLVPAAAIGVDIPRLLEGAAGLETKAGLGLGATLADYWQAGRDKITFIAPPGLDAFAGWAEQLLAESTGKDGKGLIPIQGEPIGPPAVYGGDRLFIRLRMGDSPDDLDDAAGALDAAGHPVITMRLPDQYDLGAEFLRWEIATAAAAAVMGVNPFDEPNVDEAKENTRQSLEEATRAQRIPEPEPAARLDGMQLLYDERTAARLALRREDPIGSLLAALMDHEGDYLALQAYIQPSPAHDELLREMRVLVLNATGLATTAGYGPRFLHSTGQLHKGGPDTGVFLQITADDSEDVGIPGESGYGFATLKRAQALGDLIALQNRGRRVLRAHVGADVTAGLRGLLERVRESLPAHARSGGR